MPNQMNNDERYLLLPLDEVPRKNSMISPTTNDAFLQVTEEIGKKTGNGSKRRDLPFDFQDDGHGDDDVTRL